MEREYFSTRAEFEVELEKLSNILKNQCLYLSYRNQDKADDIFQSVRLKALENWQKCYKGSVKWWLFGIARHELRHMDRINHKYVEIPNNNICGVTEQHHCFEVENVKRIKTAINLLPKNHTLAIQMRISELKNKEICRYLNWTDGYTRFILSDARRLLKQKLI